MLSDEEVSSDRSLPRKNPRRNQRQPEDPKMKFELTVIGFLFQYMRENGPSTKQELIEALQENLSNLRTKSGSKYKESPEKIIASVISKNKAFLVKGDSVSLDVKHI